MLIPGVNGATVPVNRVKIKAEHQPLIFQRSSSFQCDLVVLQLAVDYPLRIMWCSYANAASRRMALIFNGSAKLQLFFNWLPEWVNNSYLPAAVCSVIESRWCLARGQEPGGPCLGQLKKWLLLWYLNLSSIRRGEIFIRFVLGGQVDYDEYDLLT